MKSCLLNIKLKPDESFTCVDWQVPANWLRWTNWQFIDEYYIAAIVRGRGTRFIGDHTGRYKEGDLILIGPNVPVAWWSDDTPAKARHLSATFSEDFLGKKFLALPEMAAIPPLLARARRGLAFSSVTSRKVIPLLMRMSRQKGYERLRLLLDVLNLFASARDARELTSSYFSLSPQEQEAGRVAKVCKYVQTSFKGKIQRDMAAHLAGLSPNAFSRFFHQRMGCTFKAYVMEVRVGHACHLLQEEDQTIARIAFEAGFNNLSNFNHSFRKIKGVSPGEFRRQHVTVS